MFFFVAGVQPRTVSLGTRNRTCPSCGRPRVTGKRIDHYFSLFFIPLFPVGRGAPVLACEACGAVVDEREAASGPDRRPPVTPRCGACGRRVEADFSFCPTCGEPLDS